MHCRTVQRKIDAYNAEKGFAPAERAAIEEHMGSCEQCRRAAQAARDIAALARARAIPPVPEGFARRVGALARQGADRRPVRSGGWSLAVWWRSAPVPIRAAAAAVLVIGLSLGSIGGWRAARTPQPQDRAGGQTDLPASYGADYLAGAPDGSLASTYLTLVSDPAQDGE